MAYTIADRIRENAIVSATSGAFGALDLKGAVPSYKAFQTLPLGSDVPICAVSKASGQFVTGIARLTTWSRLEIVSVANGAFASLGAAGGEVDVFLTLYAGAPNPAGTIGPGGYKNLLVNGDFQVQQRGEITGNSGSYLCDRWCFFTNAASNTPSLFVDGAAGPGTYALKLTTANNVRRLGIIQWIDARLLRGKQISLSGSVNGSGGAVFFGAAILQSAESNPIKNPVNDWNSTTFTAGNFFRSGLTAADVQTVTANGQWVRFSSQNASYKNVVTTVLPDTTWIGVFLWPNTTMFTNGYSLFSDIQLEIGDTTTEFERLEWSRQLERCLPYFRYVWVAQGGYSAVSGMSFLVPITLSPPMRSAPTCTNVWQPASHSSFAPAAVADVSIKDRQGGYWQKTATLQGGVIFTGEYYLDAEIGT